MASREWVSQLIKQPDGDEVQPAADGASFSPTIRSGGLAAEAAPVDFMVDVGANTLAPQGSGWDVSTAVFNQSQSVAGQESEPQGVAFKPDGSKMYVIGTSGDDVNEYDLGTLWDVSSATFLQAFSVAGQDATPLGVTFKPDGSKMYVLGAATDSVIEYDLGTPWDVSSASFLQSFDVSSQDVSPVSVAFKPDGSKMYVLGAGNMDVFEYDLGTLWDVSSASFLQSFDVSSQDASPTSVAFKPDGSKMYVSGAAGVDVNEYDLGTSWDVSSASFLQAFSVAGQEGSPRSVAFKPDGSKMYLTGVNSDAVHEYDLTVSAAPSVPAVHTALVLHDNGGSLPGGLEPDTIYFVVNPTASTFQLSERPYGPTINITTAGVGVPGYGVRDQVILGLSDIDQYRSIEIAVETDAPGILYVGFVSDTQAPDPVERAPVMVREYTENLAAIGGATFFFGVRKDGVRARYINGPDASSFFHSWTQQRTAPVEDDRAPLAAPIDDAVSAAVTRAVPLGRLDDLSGDYANAEVHRNALGVSQLVAVGHRTGDVLQRGGIHIVSGLNLSGDSTLDTVPAGKVFYATAFVVSIRNTAQNTGGRILLRDGGSTGEVRLPFTGDAAPGGISGVRANTVSGSFENNPLPFATDVFFDAISGTISVDIVVWGYLEDA